MSVFEDEAGDAVGEPIPPEESAAVREAHGVEDVGEKFRSGEAVEAREVLGLVDAIPMRRREMCERG
jgi:hypothetical protein